MDHGGVSIYAYIPPYYIVEFRIGKLPRPADTHDSRRLLGSQSAGLRQQKAEPDGRLVL